MRFVNVDRTTPMLLPVDMREWVAANDTVHFILEAESDRLLAQGWSPRAHNNAI